MPEIKFKHVVTFTSEDKVYKADNILKPDLYRKWKCSSPGEKNASIVLQLEKATKIDSIDIGNECSAFIEVLVKRSADSESTFQVLLLASSFMSPNESRNKKNTDRVRMFGQEKLDENLKDQKWDCVKVVCTQPFNKDITYGLSFIKLRSPPEKLTETPIEKEAKKDTVKLGAFKLKIDDEDSPPSIGSWLDRKKKNSESLSTSSSQESPSYAATVLAFATSSPKPSTQTNPSKRKHDESESSYLPAKKDPSTNSVIKHKVGHTETLGARKTDESPISSRKEQTVRRDDTTSLKPSNAQSPSSSKVHDKSIHKDVGHRKNDSPKTQEKKPSSNKPEAKVKPKDVMEGVVFTISGFVNPLRSDIRDRALELGAKYKGDWDDSCTHLVCAFVNTPKYSLVRKAGHKIVTKDWIFDCHKKKTLLPWRDYLLGKYSIDSSEESESEKDDNDTKPNEKKSPKHNGSTRSEGQWKITTRKIDVGSDAGPSERKKDVLESSRRSVSRTDESEDETEDEDAIKDYIADTDADSDSGGDTEDEIRKVEEKARKKATEVEAESKKGVNFVDDDDDDSPSIILSKPDTKDLPLPSLPNLFKKRHFYLYGEFSPNKHHYLKRLISAYDGVLEYYMSDKIKYVVTETQWDKNFEQALEENEDLIFVKPDWVFKCHKAGKLLPYQPYIIIPDS